MSDGRKLVNLCTSITQSLKNDVDLRTLATTATIPTRKFKFSPVLLAYLLRISNVELDPRNTPARAMADELPRVRFSAHAPFHGWVHHMNSFSNAKNKFFIHYPGPQALPNDDLIIPRMRKTYPLFR